MKNLVLAVCLILTLLTPVSAIVIKKGDKSNYPKNLLQQIKDEMTGAYEWPHGMRPQSFYSYKECFMVSPPAGSIVPSNMTIVMVGPYQPWQLVIELWDMTNPESPKFVKNLNRYYYYNRGSRRIYNFNPQLTNSRVYEVRIYKYNDSRTKKELRATWQFQTLSDNKLFAPPR